MYIVEYYSAIKKNEILPFSATCMDVENVILNEVSQTKKGKYYITYMWNIRIIQMNLYTKQK